MRERAILVSDATSPTVQVTPANLLFVVEDIHGAWYCSFSQSMGGMVFNACVLFLSSRL
jgi:hypothetical protein